MKMSWEKLLNPSRLGSRKVHDESSRSPFHKDYDRIVFSGAFRRLNRKTQVHPLAQHDAVHTRLTHSLEVSCVGRSLGMAKSAPKIYSLHKWPHAPMIQALLMSPLPPHQKPKP